MENFEHLNGPIKSVHDNQGAPGVAGLRFAQNPEGWQFGPTELATIYSTNVWPEFAYIERRMVAAWNACAGISTDELERCDQPRCECCGYLVTQREHFACLNAHPNRLNEATTALNSILEYFRSGNSVAVQQATIQADSPEIVRAFEVLAKLTK